MQASALVSRDARTLKQYDEYKTNNQKCREKRYGCH